MKSYKISKRRTNHYADGPSAGAKVSAGQKPLRKETHQPHAPYNAVNAARDKMGGVAAGQTTRRHKATCRFD